MVSPELNRYITRNIQIIWHTQYSLRIPRLNPAHYTKGRLTLLTTLVSWQESFSLLLHPVPLFRSPSPASIAQGCNLARLLETQSSLQVLHITRSVTPTQILRQLCLLSWLSDGIHSFGCHFFFPSSFSSFSLLHHAPCQHFLHSHFSPLCYPLPFLLSKMASKSRIKYVVKEVSLVLHRNFKKKPLLHDYWQRAEALPQQCTEIQNSPKNGRGGIYTSEYAYSVLYSRSTYFPAKT